MAKKTGEKKAYVIFVEFDEDTGCELYCARDEATGEYGTFADDPIEALEELLGSNS